VNDIQLDCKAQAIFKVLFYIGIIRVYEHFASQFAAIGIIFLQFAVIKAI
jgi:hypothetical protein